MSAQAELIANLQDRLEKAEKALCEARVQLDTYEDRIAALQKELERLREDLELQTMRGDFRYAESHRYEQQITQLTTNAAQAEQLAKLAASIHYPECWDTTAYPTIERALHELQAWFQCSTEPCQLPQAEPQAGVEQVIRGALEPYAESYEMMVRGTDDAKVHCLSVATDIRQNFTTSIMHALNQRQAVKDTTQ